MHEGQLLKVFAVGFLVGALAMALLGLGGEAGYYDLRPSAEEEAATEALYQPQLFAGCYGDLDEQDEQEQTDFLRSLYGLPPIGAPPTP